LLSLSAGKRKRKRTKYQYKEAGVLYPLLRQPELQRNEPPRTALGVSSAYIATWHHMVCLQFFKQIGE
jgi:hypothetical protein